MCADHDTRCDEGYASEGEILPGDRPVCLKPRRDSQASLKEAKGDGGLPRREDVRPSRANVQSAPVPTELSRHEQSGKRVKPAGNARHQRDGVPEFAESGAGPAACRI
jgi:hypothetical protein